MDGPPSTGIALRLGPAIALWLGACAQPRPPDNVLLIVIDTLRADHLSCYGYERETSPELDRLAERGLRFTHVQSPRAKTTPSVASILTGLYPHEHGVRDFTTPFDGRVPTLAEVLRREGYRTGAIVGNFVLQDDRSGLARGFDVWMEELPQTRGNPPDDVPERTADSLTDAALAMLAESDGPASGRLRRAERPWFLWLHYMDPHGLYEAPPEHRLFEPAQPQPLNEGTRRGERIASYNVPSDAWLPDGRIDAGRVIARYDAEIHFVDAQIGRLLRDLENAGQLDDTWVIVVGDHGESLGEHGYWFEHGAYAYEATCRVPLLIQPPLAMDAPPEPGQRSLDVALADLGPTMLELAGVHGRLEARGRFAGRSLAQAVRRSLASGAQSTRPVFSEKVDRSERSRTVQTKAVRIGNWKLLRRFVQRITSTRAGGSQMELLEEELFDLAADPQEEHNRVQAPPPEAPLEELRRVLEDFVAADRDFGRLARELQERREELYRDDPESLRRLRALGY